MTDHLRDYQFKPGQPRPEGAGRKVGVRNKLSESFLRSLHAEWERSGDDCLKILAKENPEAFARLALGVLPREYDGNVNTEARVTIVTGVIRDGDTPSLPGPKIEALPAPEPKAVPAPARVDDEIAPLPRAEDVTRSAAEIERREKLLYLDAMPKSPNPSGWR